MINALIHYFDINTIFFTVLNYPMSYLEFFGTLFNLWSVYLALKNKISNWYIGIIGIILFGILFYQIRLYADLLEQIYFFVTSIYGWWIWAQMEKVRADGTKLQKKITCNSLPVNLIYLASIGLCTLGLGFIISRINIWLPALFPQPASFPYLDAFIAIMSFAANWLLAVRKMDNWYLWIAVDVISVGLYYAKGVKFVSLLYAIFLVMAIQGLRNWFKEWRGYGKE